MAVETHSSAPELSVVIASVNGWETLGPTLNALDSQPERPRMEVVVVDRKGGATRERVKARRPEVMLIEVNEPMSIPPCGIAARSPLAAS